MSASNVEFLTPAAAQDARRRIIFTEKKLSSETRRGGTNGKNADNMRGHYLLEQPKNMAEVKGVSVASPPGSHRKKGMPKPKKPKFQIFLSILTRICLFLVAVLWVGLLIWRWRDMIKYSNGFSAFDSESRLSDLDASLKKSAKTLQDQIDAVNERIGTEIGLAKTELRKQVEEKRMMFEEDLRRLMLQTDKLDNSLADFKGMGLLSKEELQTFLNEIKERRPGDSKDEVAFDDIIKLAKDIVEKEIEKHAADGLGWVDYALASGGAKVISHSEPYIVGKSRNWLALAKDRNQVYSKAQKMLEPSFGEPGQCFALQGNNGFVRIRLRTGIIAEAVTLEHVSKSVAYDRSSAPKDCAVSAWFEEPESGPTNLSEVSILTNFSYDLEKSNAQTFKVEMPISRIINTVQLDFSSNHGSSTLTCIYRFRVHGFEPNSINAAA